MELGPAPYLLSIESLSRLLDGFGDGEWPCGIASRGSWEMRMEAEKEGVHAYLQKYNARESVNSEDGLPGARFLNFFEIENLKFRKNLKKIWDVDNDGLYTCAKNQHELLCILGCIKLINFQI
jgi:hypothetical protein